MGCGRYRRSTKSSLNRLGPLDFSRQLRFAAAIFRKEQLRPQGEKDHRHAALKPMRAPLGLSYKCRDSIRKDHTAYLDNRENAVGENPEEDDLRPQWYSRSQQSELR